MPFKVNISERAEKNLDQIVEYLDTEWSVRIRSKYLNMLESKINFIAQNPLMFQVSSKKRSIRRCVVNKQTALFYRVRKDEIEVITIQHNRRDNRKLKL